MNSPDLFNYSQRTPLSMASEFFSTPPHMHTHTRALFFIFKSFKKIAVASDSNHAILFDFYLG